MKKLEFKKSEAIFILLNSIESKFIICGMISMKIETLTDVSFEAGTAQKKSRLN